MCFHFHSPVITDFKASMVVATPSGSVVWRLHNHSAFALVQSNPTLDHSTNSTLDQSNPITSLASPSAWIKICDNVASLSLSLDTGWVVKLDGGLVCHTVQKAFSSSLLLSNTWKNKSPASFLLRDLERADATAPSPGSSTWTASSHLSCNGGKSSWAWKVALASCSPAPLKTSVRIQLGKRCFHPHQ